MLRRRSYLLLALLASLALLPLAPAGAKLSGDTWPPPLTGAGANGTVTLKSDEFLQVPDTVKKEMEKPGFAAFAVAKAAPSIDVAYHQGLPDAAINGTGWTSWGDICVADDGKVYCGIGDHGTDFNGRVYMYEWDPTTKTLKKVLDLNSVSPRGAEDVHFAKVHAGIQQTKDGMILVIGTLADGGTAGQVKWTDKVQGSQVIQYDPANGEAQVLFSLPHRCTATTLMDRARNVMYLCLEGNEDKELKGSALAAFDPLAKNLTYRSPDNVVVANRKIAMDHEGNVYFNGKDGELWRYDPKAKSIAGTGMVLSKEGEGEKAVQNSMRSATDQAKDGWIYGSTMGSKGQLFRFNPQAKKVEMLGNDFGHGEYTTVSVLSPDEKYVYYLPGAHGGAKDVGTPVVQYNIATGDRKVLAFLRPYMEKTLGYVPGGTYGVKLSKDGSTLYANLNGHTRDDLRPEKMTAGGFGHTSFVAIAIPESERK
jgi:hypothetical protein